MHFLAKKRLYDRRCCIRRNRDKDHTTGEADIKFGYCTEFIIMLNKPMTDKQERDFKSYLESIGDSIVVVADDEITKFMYIWTTLVLQSRERWRGVNWAEWKLIICVRSIRKNWSKMLKNAQQQRRRGKKQKTGRTGRTCRRKKTWRLFPCPSEKGSTRFSEASVSMRSSKVVPDHEPKHRRYIRGDWKVHAKIHFILPITRISF